MLQNSTLSLLDDLIPMIGRSDGLSLRICRQHLAWLGVGEGSAFAQSTRQSGAPDTSLAGDLTLRPKPDSHTAAVERLNCQIHWQNPYGANCIGTEATIQALSGLMAVHGRDQLRPRRLGLEVASVAAGVVATQGILAALIANCRGLEIQAVETSVLPAALLFLNHHLAIATCEGDFSFPAPAATPGPPFDTADGFWVELEMLSFKAWTAFWQQLGIDAMDLLQDGWVIFVYRYLAGQCGLPAAFHEATRRQTLAELRRIAGATGTAICRVRNYPEWLADAGAPYMVAPWTISSGSEEALPVSGVLSPDHQPLSGLRVVEMTSRLQGPLASHLLRWLGAEVIKLEPPGGDFGRSSPPLAGNLGAAYLAYNRDKQVIEVDYKQPQGRTAIMDWVATADVFVQNWPSGRAERLGFDFEDFHRINPGLVYAHASGWGQADQEPSSIAGDFLVQAHAGCGDGLNPEGKLPFPSRLTLVDVMGGLLACEGILAGLYRRERTRRGCRVDTSLLAGAMSLQAHVLRAVATGQETNRRRGRPLWSALEQPIETPDGFLLVDAADRQSRRRLAQVCGVCADGDDETTVNRIIKALQRQPATEWELCLFEAGIPATAVCCQLSQLPHDPHVAPYLERVNDTCWVPAAPWQFKP